MDALVWSPNWSEWGPQWTATWHPNNHDVFVLTHPSGTGYYRVTFQPTVATEADGRELAQRLVDTTRTFLKEKTS